MRHRRFSQRLSRPADQRKAVLRSLLISLIKYERIRTTKHKAKFIQASVDRLIHLGKQNTLAARRQANRLLNDKKVVVKLFAGVAPLFKDKESGFTRIIRYAHRKGDGAELVFLELTERALKQKPKKIEGEKPHKPEEPRPSEKPKPEKEKPHLPKAQPRLEKKLKPKKFLGGLRRLFKKERDSL